MDKCFGRMGRERRAEAGNVPEMIKGCFGDVFDVAFIGKGLVQNDAKIAEMRGGGNCGAINWEGKVIVGFGE